jgi:hypothetical protein
MKFAILLIVILAALMLLNFIGLIIKPPSFAPFPKQPGSTETIPLPDDLTGPVERFYRQVYGDRIPLGGILIYTKG